MSESSITDEELCSRARETLRKREDCLRLAHELPACDEILSKVLHDAAARRDETAFSRLWIAALMAGRRPPTSALAMGAELFPDSVFVAASIFLCTGDFASALIEAVKRGRMGSERDAFCLVAAAIWLSKKRGGEYPRELIREARKVGRLAGSNRIVHLLMCDFVKVTANEEVAEIIGYQPVEGGRSPTFIESVADVAGTDPWQAITGEKQAKGVVLHSGYTVRRAVPKHGRNEPCPCGSGKKYKKCCLKQDEERLRNSSEVPGITRQEIQEHPEMFLTADRLKAMRAHELVKLDYSALPRELLHVLFDQLLIFNEFEEMVRILGNRLEGEDQEDWWFQTMFLASDANRRDIVEKLLDFELAQTPGFDGKELPLSVQLVLADRRREPVVDLLEEHFKRLLFREESDSRYADWEGWTADLLSSEFPALGITVARGAYAMTESGMLLESIEEARDILDLSPSDPIETVVSPVPFPALGTHHRDDDNLVRAEEEISEKSRQVNDLKKELSAIRERLAAAETAEKATKRAPTPDEGATDVSGQVPAPTAAEKAAKAELEQMRRRFKEVKEDLKARHRERNELRKELGDALEELEQSNAELEITRRTEENASEDDEREEDSLTSEILSDHDQPWRIPVYSARFCHDLESLPANVARHVLRTAGDLAAGLGQTFSHVRKLKAAPSLLRARVGIHHRLLFSVQDRQIEFVAAIPRKELEGFIKQIRK